jgi:hypothetical protein
MRLLWFCPKKSRGDLQMGPVVLNMIEQYIRESEQKISELEQELLHIREAVFSNAGDS